ncbi:MAG: hypothetical protein NWS96_05870, partial [Pseudomonadales bacterium]|nr:hypothetical protein [Pseudomonadales bacterium]
HFHSSDFHHRGRLPAQQASRDEDDAGVKRIWVEVGDLFVAALPGVFPEEILLGTSFQRHVKLSENAGLM